MDGMISVGHPVDVASGAVFTAAHDVELPGTFPLIWSRFYSTASMQDAAHGERWANPFLIRIERDDEGHRLIDETGAAIPLGRLPDAGAVALRLIGPNLEIRRTAAGLRMVHWHPGPVDDIDVVNFERIDDNLYRLHSYSNAAGHRLVVRYDSAGRLAAIRQEVEARELAFGYGDDGLIAELRLRCRGESDRTMARYTYHGRHLVRVEDATGAVVAYAYDAQGRMVAETGQLGATFSFRYDVAGRCVETSGPSGYMKRSLRFLATPSATEVTDSLGLKSLYIVNPHGQVVQEVSPTGATKTTTFDAHGRIERVRFADGGEKRCEYDERGNRVLVVDQFGAKTRRRYDDMHRTIETTDARGATTRYRHDERGLLVSVTNALSQTWRYERDARGLVVRFVSPGGTVRTMHYGDDMRRYELRDAVGLVHAVDRDAFGKVVRFHDAAGVSVESEFDVLGRPVRHRFRSGAWVSYEWNPLGLLTARTDSSGATDRWTFDPMGFLLGHVDPLGRLESMRYDTEGRLKAVMNRAGETARFDYDASGSLADERTFDGRTIRYANDAEGYPVVVTRPDGRVVRQKFDRCGRVVTRESDDGLAQSFDYDVSGAVVRIVSADGEVALERDLLGRVTRETALGCSVVSAFDDDGRRHARTIDGVPDAAVHIQFDGRDRPRSVTVGTAGLSCETTWDDRDRVRARTYGTGLREEFDYDAAGRPTSQRVFSGTRLIVDRRYQWDGVDRLAAKSDSARGELAYSYDPVGRLLQVRRNGVLVETYEYSDAEALLGTQRGAFTVAAGGRTVRTPEREYVHDDNGCVTDIREPRGAMRLAFDADNQLRTVTSDDGSTTTYGYDGFGRRVRKTTGDKTLGFVWDGADLAATVSDGQVRDLFWMERMVPRFQFLEGSWHVAAVDETQAVQELFDSHGELASSMTFDAYGRSIASAGGPTSPFRFRGQYFDAETGLHYNLRRYYDPTSAGYMSPDPLGVDAGPNPYAYPRNPLDWDDPFGLSCSDNHADESESQQSTAMVPYDGEFATKQVLGTTTTPGGRTILFHAADRMVNPPKGRAPMTPADVDLVLDGATNIRKVQYHPQGDTITVQNKNMPGAPQVIVDAATGTKVITVVNPKPKGS